MVAHNSGQKVEAIEEEPEVPTEQSARVQDVVGKTQEQEANSVKEAKKDDDQVELDSGDGDAYAEDDQRRAEGADRDSDEVDPQKPGLSASPAKGNLSQSKINDQEREEMEMNYQIEKSQEEIQEQGYLQNFFECPYEY